MHQEDNALERKFCRSGDGVTLAEGFAISGYASVFGAGDLGGDVVMPGAYGRSLARLKAEGRQVKMLWQHDATQPIGVWDEVAEDGRGLFVRGRILADVARGREAAALVAAGAIDGLSIGYRTVMSDKDGKGRRRLHEVDLWEVSLVTFPMLPQARVGTKSHDALQAGLTQMVAELRAACRALNGRGGVDARHVDVR